MATIRFTVGLLAAVHVGLQNHGGGDLVDERFVAACHTTDAALADSALGDYRGEAFVVKHDLLVGKPRAQTGCERLDETHRLGRRTVHLRRLAEDYRIDVVGGAIVGNVTFERLGIDRLQRTRDDAQRVADGESRPLRTVIYCENPSHVRSFVRDGTPQPVRLTTCRRTFID